MTGWALVRATELLSLFMTNANDIRSAGSANPIDPPMPACPNAVSASTHRYGGTTPGGETTDLWKPSVHRVRASMTASTDDADTHAPIRAMAPRSRRWLPISPVVASGAYMPARPRALVIPPAAGI